MTLFFSYKITERISLSLSWCGRECLQEICFIPWSFSLTIASYQRGINLQEPQGAWWYACSLSLPAFRYKGRCKQIWVGWEGYKWEGEPLSIWDKSHRQHWDLTEFCRTYMHKYKCLQNLGHVHSSTLKSVWTSSRHIYYEEEDRKQVACPTHC